VIKEPDYVKHWQARTPEERNYVLVIWSSVLRWELEKSKPKLVILLGKKIEEHTKFLRLNGLIRLPETITIHHYSYIGSYPEGSLPPMHPDRVQSWDEDFAKLASRYEEIKIR